MKKKEGTPDLRPKLVTEAIKSVAALLKKKGYEPDKTVIEEVANQAIDEWIEQWYEVSLEAMELKDGEADFVTDEEIDDPELMEEAKLRIIKELYEEPPEDFYENIAESIVDSQ